MKRLIILSMIFLLLTVSGLFSYAVVKKNGNEIKWRPLPATLSYKMNSSEPNSACSTKTKNAFQAWEDEGRSNVDYNYAGEVATNSISNDGTNLVLFPANHATWLAGCYWWYNTSTYALLEFDIAVYQNWKWHYGDNPQGDTYDFQSTMTHEVGHTLSLLDLYLNTNKEKTMYGYGTTASTKQRTLEQDDKDGIAYLYPTDSVDKVWIKTATDDDGVVKYPGDVFWQSPDISFKPDPPVIASPCSVFVTARNMRPVNQTARIIIEVHDPDVSLRARTSVLYADTLIDKTIPTGNHESTGSDGWNDETWANSKGDGETTYVFMWTPDSNTFGEDHYCFVATVESGSDTLRDLDVPDDNDIACHNFNTVKGGSGGSGSLTSFGAGNPTGMAVWRHLNLEPIYMPAGWTYEMPPFPDSMYLTPLDTFFPVPVVITPPASALRGDYGIVQVRCTLKYYSPPFPILMTGGIIYKLIVGEPGDVGATRIDCPTGNGTPGGLFETRAVVKNFGATTEIFAVKFKIGDVYSDDSSNITLAPGESLEIAFDPWIATIGSYVVSCSTELTNDWRTYNDKVSVSFAVATVQSGWTQKESIPNFIKDGGALVTVPGEKSGDLLYALRGSKSKEFYMYDPEDGWIAKETIPFGYKPPELVKINKKYPGKGAAFCYDGVNTIYTTKGNGTWELWAYDVDANTWTAKAFVPSTQKLKGGTSMAYYEGLVYLLAGAQKKDNLNNFFAYDPTQDTALGLPWTTLAGAPITPPVTGKAKPFKDGSAISIIGNTIYAIKGGDKFNFFYAYDIAIDIWTEMESIPLVHPRLGKKNKVGDGGAMTTDGSILYVIKGKGKQDFWSYSPIVKGTWNPLDTIPRLHKKSVPKTGAALAYANGAVWLLKGNKTPEFWKYVPTKKMNKDEHKPSTSMAIMTDKTTSMLKFNLTVLPNPFTKFTTINYTVPISKTVSLKLYSVTGRVVKTLLNGYVTAGRYTIKLATNRLAKGVYFLRYSDNTNQKELKLIVQ